MKNGRRKPRAPSTVSLFLGYQEKIFQKALLSAENQLLFTHLNALF